MKLEELPEEVPWVLDVNGKRVSAATSSPGDWHALCAGRLLAEGFIHSGGELLSCTSKRLPSATMRIVAQVPPDCFESAWIELQHRLSNGCGLLHFVSCAPGVLKRQRAPFSFEHELAAQHLKRLFAACDAASPAGGVHGAALAAGNGLGEPSIDVTRHSAVDRALGTALLSLQNLSQAGLILTARISGQIALAAARAGLAWVASRSVPTRLAVALAAGAGLPLIARAASREVHVFGA
jgi:formate dehydrogenase accessory protein FdhD